MEAKALLIQSRLNYWFVPDILQDLVSEVSICPDINTDHSAICLKVCSNDNNVEAPSYWKFYNNSLCDDKSYYKELNGNVAVWEQKYSNIEDVRILGESLKFEIRYFIQTFSKKKKSQGPQRSHQKLEDLVKVTERNLCVNPFDTTERAWEQAKSNLETEYEYVTRGIIMRSTAVWVEKGERNYKYFLNLEKANKIKSTIRTVIDENGETVSDSMEVFEKIKNFYGDLYSERPVNLIGQKSVYLE